MTTDLSPDRDELCRKCGKPRGDPTHHRMSKDYFMQVIIDCWFEAEEKRDD